MRTASQLTAIIIFLGTAALFPPESFGAQAVKFRHVRSIYSDAEGLGLKHPEGVACNESAQLVVADTGNGRLMRYVFKNETLEAGAAEIKISQLTYPLKTQTNSKNEIYVLDGRQRRIVELTPEGVFRRYLEPRNLAAPAAYLPRSIAVDTDDNIYILDILSERVLVLDPAGEFRRQIDFPQEYGFFSDLTVDGRGKVLLIDSVNAMVFSAAANDLSFTPFSKRLNEYMRFPVSLATDIRQRVYLTDRNGGSVIILGQDGAFLGRQSAMGWKEGFLNYPSQVCINTRGEIFIADTNNNRIQIFTNVE